MTDESDTVDHRKWAGGFYCKNHDAGFETQEASRNGGCCPWCGENVEALL